MNQLPTTFWAQAAARLSERSPKFYNLILGNTTIIILLTYVIPYLFLELIPEMGWPMPKAVVVLLSKLVFIREYLVAAGIGAGVVAKTTLDTTGTPPLVTKGDEVTESELSVSFQNKPKASL